MIAVGMVAVEMVPVEMVAVGMVAVEQGDPGGDLGRPHVQVDRVA